MLSGLLARFSWNPGLWTAAVLHLAVLALLLSHAPVREAISEATPLMVSLLPGPPAVKPTELPKPKPVARQTPQPTQPQPVLAAATQAAPQATWVAPQAEPRALEPLAAAAPPAPAAVAPPRFDAEYLNNPPPQYPAVSRRLGEQGRVMLHVLVSAAGLPLEVRLRTSSGFERLDAAALETVKQWKFVAARQGDTAVSAWVLVPIAFSIRS
jgi:periplasmic protein TonB